MARYGFHVATTVVSHFTILLFLKAALITLFTAIIYTFLPDSYNRAYAEIVLVATAIVLYLVGRKRSSPTKSHSAASTTDKAPCRKQQLLTDPIPLIMAEERHPHSQFTGL